MANKACIYDTSKGLGSLIKLHYSDKIEFSTIGKNNFKKSLEKNDFNICFFIVNDMDDYFNLLKIYNYVEHFFIGSPKKFLCQKIDEIKYDDVVVIDLNLNKNDILKIINFNLRQKELI